MKSLIEIQRSGRGLLTLPKRNYMIDYMRGGRTSLNMNFATEPGEVMDFFFSLWMFRNAERVMERREESGLPRISDFEKWMMEQYQENSELLKLLAPYTNYLFEPTYILPPDTLFSYPTIESFLEAMVRMTPEETRLQISRVLTILLRDQSDEQEEVADPIYSDEEMLTMLEESQIPSEVKWELYLLVRNKQAYLDKLAMAFSACIPLYRKIMVERARALEGWNQKVKAEIEQDPEAFLRKFEKYYDFSSFDTIQVTSSAMVTLYISLDKDGEVILMLGPNSELALQEEDSDEDLKKALVQLGNLTENSKFMILQFLAEGDHFGQEIAERLDLTKPTVSHHMNYIISQHWVTVRQSGVRMYYRLNRDQVLRDLEHATRLIRQALAEPESPPIQ